MMNLSSQLGGTQLGVAQLGQLASVAVAPQKFSISGSITGGAGALVSLTGAATATTTADGTGAYSFSGLANGTYTITPTLSRAVFTPASLAVTVNNGNITGANFVATLVPVWPLIGGTQPEVIEKKKRKKKKRNPAKRAASIAGKPSASIAGIAGKLKSRRRAPIEDPVISESVSEFVAEAVAFELREHERLKALIAEEDELLELSVL